MQDRGVRRDMHNAQPQPMGTFAEDPLQDAARIETQAAQDVREAGQPPSIDDPILHGPAPCQEGSEGLDLAPGRERAGLPGAPGGERLAADGVALLHAIQATLGAAREQGGRLGMSRVR